MKKFTKLTVAKSGTIISGMITMLILLSDVVFRIYLFLTCGFESTIDDAAVGIIGGADGPTAIFISSGSNPYSKVILVAVFFIITILCAMKWKKLSDQ